MYSKAISLKREDVFFCNLTNLHAKLLEAIFYGGKNVFCEKSFCKHYAKCPYNRIELPISCSQLNTRRQ